MLEKNLCYIEKWLIFEVKYFNDNIDLHVYRVLEDNEIGGPLPPSLGNLSKLKRL